MSYKSTDTIVLTGDQANCMMEMVNSQSSEIVKLKDLVDELKKENKRLSNNIKITNMQASALRQKTTEIEELKKEIISLNISLRHSKTMSIQSSFKDIEILRLTKELEKYKNQRTVRVEHSGTVNLNVKMVKNKEVPTSCYERVTGKTFTEPVYY